MSKSRPSGLAIVATTVTIALTVLLSSCPLPFEFSPRGTSGGSGGSDDPANPAVTAAPTCILVSKVTGEVLTIIDNDALVLLETETRNAVIYYQIIDPAELADPPTPQPGHPDTNVYNPLQPPEVTGHLSSFAFVAMAIGPNMYPSVLISGVVQVLYSMAATPVFSPTPGTPGSPVTHATDFAVAITSPDAGAEIWYTEAPGPGPAPDPEPGVVGQLYVGPIPVSGDGTTRSFSAIAVVDQKENSFIGEASYTIAYPTATIADGDGFININENGTGVPVNVVGAATAGMTYSATVPAGGTIAPATGAYDGSLTLALSNATEGPVTVDVTLTDADGNSVVISATSVVDLTPPPNPTPEAHSPYGPGPNIGTTSIPAGARIFGTQVQFVVPSFGPGSIWRYRYNPWGSSWTSWTPGTGTLVRNITSAVPDGSSDTLWFEVQEQDVAGNFSGSTYYTVLIDRRPATYSAYVWSWTLDAIVNITFRMRPTGPRAEGWYIYLYEHTYRLHYFLLPDNSYTWTSFSFLDTAGDGWLSETEEFRVTAGGVATGGTPEVLRFAEIDVYGNISPSYVYP